MSKAVQLFVITKQKLIAIAACIIALILIGIICYMCMADDASSVFKFASKWPDVETYELDVTAAARRELPIYCVEREDKKIAFTIDAAWEDFKTEEILDILDKNEIKTTWFLCGYWVDNCKDKVKLIADKGHEIGNHSATHPHMSKLTATQIEKELKDMDDKLEKITNKRSTLFRPPFGEYDDNVIRASKKAGYEVIQWDVDTIDWKNERSVDTIIKTVMGKVKPGSIILAHNNAKHITEYLPLLIKELKAQGYEFVTVSELIHQGQTTIDANGMQKKAVSE